MIQKVGVIVVGEEAVIPKRVLRTASVLQTNDVRILSKKPLQTAHLGCPLEPLCNEANDPHC